MKKPMLIILAGTTCSGKNNLVSYIKKEAEKSGKKVAVVATQSFFINDEDEKGKTLPQRMTKFLKEASNWDTVMDYDETLLVSKIKQLLLGKDVEIPIRKSKIVGWDNENLVAGSIPQRILWNTQIDDKRLIKSSDIIIVEGWASFKFSELREMTDLGIFLDADADLRLMRKIQRSPYYRKFDSTQTRHKNKQNFGSSPHKGEKGFIESIISGFYYWKEIFRAYELEFVVPQKKYADLIFENNNSCDEIDKNAQISAEIVKLYFENEPQFRQKVAQLRAETKKQDPQYLMQELKQQLETSKRERERIYWWLGGIGFLCSVVLLALVIIKRKRKIKKTIKAKK